MPTMQIVNGADFVAVVKQIIALNPSTTYVKDERCFYAPTKLNPMGCVMGAALSAVGFDVTSTSFGEQMEGSNISDVLARLNIETTDAQDEWLNYLQSMQDLGRTWDEARIAADRELRELGLSL